MPIENHTSVSCCELPVRSVVRGANRFRCRIKHARHQRPKCQQCLSCLLLHAQTRDGATNLSPYVGGGRNGFYVYRSDMSLAPANQPPAPMTAVTIYVLHPGAAPDFIAAIKKINEALGKQPDWPKTSGWLQLANGGEGPTFVLLSSRKNWADFAPLPKTPADVLTETYGKEMSDQIQKTIRDCTAHLFTETAVHRADLSYVPGK